MTKSAFSNVKDVLKKQDFDHDSEIMLQIIKEDQQPQSTWAKIADILSGHSKNQKL